MENNKKYLIALDLDDTLLNNESNISENTINYLRELDKKGHIIVISTGRPYQAMKDIYDSLGINSPIISHNGAYVTNPGDSDFINFEEKISISDVKNSFIKNKKYITSALCLVNGDMLFYNRSPKLDFFAKLYKAKNIIEGDLDEICNGNPKEMVYIVKTEYCNEFEESFKDFDEIGVRIWGKDKKNALYEVFLKKINKATGIKYLMDYYKIDIDNVIAFGDGINDVSMIEFAKIGVAMKNGNIDTIKRAKYVTQYTNDEDGVIRFLESINIK